jgi:hypothetical protein
MTNKIFNSAVQAASENKKQCAARNSANSQFENAKVMESLNKPLSNREKVAKVYARMAESVAFHVMGVDKSTFAEIKEQTNGFKIVFSECSIESAKDQGLTDNVKVGRHTFYIKKQDVTDAYSVVRSFESFLKVEAAKQVEARQLQRAKENETATLKAAAALLGISVEQLKAMKQK